MREVAPGREGYGCRILPADSHRQGGSRAGTLVTGFQLCLWLSQCAGAEKEWPFSVTSLMSGVFCPHSGAPSWQQHPVEMTAPGVASTSAVSHVRAWQQGTQAPGCVMGKRYGPTYTLRTPGAIASVYPLPTDLCHLAAPSAGAQGPVRPSVPIPHSRTSTLASGSL